ncbi:MAG: hypothetical protein ABI612_03525 [Betaproteobacteria bacterium]
MAADITIELASLRFEGRRFENRSLDVECTQELIAYRNLVLACAKELYRRKQPQRSRLPKGFEDEFRLQFNRLEDGSAVVPLQRVRVVEQGELELGNLDEFDEAAELIDAAIAAADVDEPLPLALPPNVIPLFRDFGKTLRADEVLFTRARRTNNEAPYTARARKRLAEWVGPIYEDVVDVVGEVRMVNLGPGAFALQCYGTEGLVSGKFSPEQEALVLEALREHRIARLRVRGVGEFSTTDRLLKKFARVDSAELAPTGEVAFDESAQPIWEQLGAIGRSAPKEAWEVIPSDLSTRIDEVVYGTGSEGS